MPIHSRHSAEPGPNVEVLATLDDGTPAITSTSWDGDARCCSVPTSLFPPNVADQRWREFFQAFVKSLGTPTASTSGTSSFRNTWRGMSHARQGSA
ncbi:MAG: hypothetical protein Ct9H300mP1_17620 [Planctomycetaceae bacterium]|nr:MAG: hypothetical protein Ct9H300mP1_17620 [Planctomycetaceae bacterium]